MTVVVWDTETSDLPLWDQPSEDPRQPHVAQFAAVIHDDEGNDRGHICLTARQDGWTCGAKALQTNGLTPEIAAAYGVDEKLLLRAFVDLAKIPGVRMVAHNESFDWRIMRIAMLRFGMSKERATEIAKTCDRHCTMKLATPVVQLPPTEKMLAAGRNTFKSVNLTECIRFFFNESHEKAHDAMADVRACGRVYFHLLSERKGSEQIPTPS